MEDEKIVALYWARDEQAIEETQKKYGAYCRTVARRILGNDADAEECVNDTYRAAWGSIPPHRPQFLSAYLAKLTRRISMKVWRYHDSQKRGGGEVTLSLEELGQCVPGGKTLEATLDGKLLTETINDFLLELNAAERRVFVCRYFHGLSIREICRKFGFSKSKTESMLFRTRKKLKDRLEREGWFV